MCIKLVIEISCRTVKSKQMKTLTQKTEQKQSS